MKQAVKVLLSPGAAIPMFPAETRLLSSTSPKVCLMPKFGIKCHSVVARALGVFFPWSWATGVDVEVLSGLVPREASSSSLGLQTLAIWLCPSRACAGREMGSQLCSCSPQGCSSTPVPPCDLTQLSPLPTGPEGPGLGPDWAVLGMWPLCPLPPNLVSLKRDRENDLLSACPLPK